MYLTTKRQFIFIFLKNRLTYVRFRTINTRRLRCFSSLIFIMNKSFENKMSPALSMFNHIYKEFNEIYHEATLKMGLSDSAFDILYSIVDLGDGCSQSDICKYSCLSKQTVNSSIKKMSSLNYLTFKPGKGRVMQIFLTDKGRQLLDEKIYPIIKKENEAFLCMTDEECRLMLELY